MQKEREGERERERQRECWAVEAVCNRARI